MHDSGYQVLTYNTVYANIMQFRRGGNYLRGTLTSSLLYIC